MAYPQQAPQQESDMERELGASLREAMRIDPRTEAPRPPRLRPEPVAAAPGINGSGGAGEKVGPLTPARSQPETTPGIEFRGPTSQRITSPLELLVQVAENTTRLHTLLEGLVTQITGEQAPPKRLRTAPRKGSGLLPAISHLAHEIDASHAELARLINHVARQL